MINLDDLVLEQINFELRFDKGYLYWDNTGKIWKEISHIWPSVQAEDIDTKQAKLVMKDEDISMGFSSLNFFIGQQYPSNLNKICEFGDSTFEIVMNYLEVDLFTRVGNRFIYSLKFDDKEQASSLLKTTGFFSVVEEKVSKIGNTVKDPSMKFTVVKDDEIGYTISLALFSRKLEIQLPKPLRKQMPESKFSETGLKIDIDFHTLKPIERGNVKTSELIKKKKKDIDYIIANLFL